MQSGPLPEGLSVVLGGDDPACSQPTTPNADDRSCSRMYVPFTSASHLFKPQHPSLKELWTRERFGEPGHFWSICVDGRSKRILLADIVSCVCHRRGLVCGRQGPEEHVEPGLSWVPAPRRRVGVLSVGEATLGGCTQIQWNLLGILLGFTICTMMR